MAEDKVLRPKLTQWCSLCGTWCASNGAVKLHLARSHADTWKPHCDRVEKLCKTQTASITSPCSLCGSHVLFFFSILLELLINGGIGQASGAGSVQTLITSARTSQPGNGGLDRQQSGKTEQKAEAVDESGQARETRPQAPVRKSGAGIRPAQEDGRDATAFWKPRQQQLILLDCGFTWFMAHGHGAGQHPPCDVQHQQGVAQDSEHHLRSDQQTAVHYDDGVHSDGVQGKGDEDNTGHGYEGDGRVSGTVHRSGPVGVQKMEPGPKDPGVDEHPAPAFPDTGQHAGHDAEGHSGAGGAAQVPCIQAAARRYDWRQGGGVLHHTGGAPWCSGEETVCQPGAALRLRGTSPAKEQTKAGKAADNRDRKSSGGSSAQAATKLQLRNSGNVCYVNTTVHMIAWMMEQCGAQVTCLGAGANAFKSVLMAGKSCNVLQLFTWRHIF